MIAKSKCVLIIDARERHVTRHAHELSTVTYEVKQITVGDYIVISPTGQIIAAIERKSLDDYGASLKDGRADNINKLIALRAECNCRILYIIEGPTSPDPNAMFAGVPYRYIESNIFHITVRDSVCVLRSRDSLDTAKMLARFIISMDSLCKKCPEPTERTERTDVIGAENANSNDSINSIDNNSVHSASSPSSDLGSFDLAILTRRYEKSTHEVARELWSCFPGISVDSADEYIKHWSVGAIICGEVAQETIRAFKLSSGRKISKKVIAGLTIVSPPVQIRLLAHIPGISRGTAAMLLEHRTLAELLTCADLPALAAGARRLGEKKANDIKKYFNYMQRE